MNTIILDRAANISVQGGMVRIGCNAISPEGKEEPSGVIVLSASAAGPVITSLVKMLQELADKQQAKLAEKAGEAN